MCDFEAEETPCVSQIIERFSCIANNRVFSCLQCDAELDYISRVVKAAPDDTYRDILIDLLTTYDGFSSVPCESCSIVSALQNEYAYFLLRVFDLNVENYYFKDQKHHQDLTRARKRARIA